MQVWRLERGSRWNVKEFHFEGLCIAPWHQGASLSFKIKCPGHDSTGASENVNELLVLQVYLSSTLVRPRV